MKQFVFSALAGVIGLAVSAGAYGRQQWSTASKPSLEHDAAVVYQADDEKRKDVVMMDDFIFGEPRAVR